METVKIGDLSMDHAALPEGSSIRPHPLLFIHGMHGGSWAFHRWMEAAAEAGWDVWALNLRGHCDSRPVENFGKVSLMHYVEDVEDVLRHIGPAILVGHSMGGLIAQLVADRNPDIPAVVLCNSAASRGIFPGSWATLSTYWKLRYVIATALQRPLQPHKGDMMSLVLNRLPWSVAESTFLSLGPESGLAARELTFWWLRGPELRIDCPVLVIGATDDRLTPVSIQRKIAGKYRRTEYKEFPGAHMLPLENGWEESIQYILKWAADHNL